MIVSNLLCAGAIAMLSDLLASCMLSRVYMYIPVTLIGSQNHHNCHYFKSDRYRFYDIITNHQLRDHNNHMQRHSMHIKLGNGGSKWWNTDWWWRICNSNRWFCSTLWILLCWLLRSKLHPQAGLHPHCSPGSLLCFWYGVCQGLHQYLHNTWDHAAG